MNDNITHQPATLQATNNNASTTSLSRQMSSVAKIPVNKIKRIMQANKEIGKIQQNTPYLLANAL